jgi:hypothetical protein
MTQPLTPTEIAREWLYRYEERLGILAGANVPTPEQIAIATHEANKWADQYLKAAVLSRALETSGKAEAGSGVAGLNKRGED